MKILVFAVFIFSLILFGCGGTIGNGSSASVYVGSYAGNYSEPSIPQNGSVALVVDQNGVLSGSTTNAATQVSSTITGTVDNSNNINGSLSTTTTTNNVPTTTTVTFSGTFVPGAPVNNTVPYTATLSIASGTTTYADTWNLVQTVSGFSKHKAF